MSENKPSRSRAGFFDIRNIVGALLLLYGVILVIVSFSTSDAQRAKANGINANLWVGLCMLLAGACSDRLGRDPADHRRRGGAREEQARGRRGRRSTDGQLGPTESSGRRQLRQQLVLPGEGRVRAFPRGRDRGAGPRPVRRTRGGRSVSR